MTVINPNSVNSKMTRREAVESLWYKGILYWKLNTAQKKIYQLYNECKSRIPVIQCSRRGGKSYSLIILALEQCIKKPDSIVHYACPTAVMATKIVIPTVNMIIKDCPVDLKPVYHKADRAFTFPNGSKIQIEGVDEGNAERLRGSSSNLAIVDEAGFVDDLEYLVNDILLPQVATTNGKMILSSTPPKSTAHPFLKFVNKAKLKDSYIRLSMPEILELIKNDELHLRQHLDPAVIEELKEATGGENSPSWRREFLAENITDVTSAVLPEFTEVLEKEIVIENQKPEFYYYFTAMDPGMVDGTGILYAYIDFKKAKLVIEDEFVSKGNDITTENLASDIKFKENLHFKSSQGQSPKLGLRVSDNNEPILLNDLYTAHKLSFVPSHKDDKEAAINDVRIKLLQKKILINPRCKNLIFQLRTVVWNKSRKSFQRNEDAGHFDLIDALIYLVRMAQWSRNPYPNIQIDSNKQFGRNNSNLTQSGQSLKNIFIKKKAKSK